MLQVSLPKEKLDALNVGDEQNVSDLVVLTVGSVGENVSARRVIHVGVSPDSHLATYMHLAGTIWITLTYVVVIKVNI